MVEVKPFRAIRYTKKAGKLEDLIAQPYDKIDAEMQKMYYDKSTYSYCRLTLPMEEDRYNIARQRLEQWLKEEILKKDEEPAFYVYFQEFELFGKKYTRKGFIGALKLHPFEENIVLPHEKTHKGPKIDRLNMLKATEHTLEPGFILYSDPDGISTTIFDEISKSEPIIDVVDSLGVRNKVWRLTDKEKIRKIQEVFEGEQLVIADGHHRYETACTYRDMRREQAGKWDENDAFNYRMTYLVPIEDKGLVVLATHRCLTKVEVTAEKEKELSKYFELKEIPKQEIPTFLNNNTDNHAFVYYQNGKATAMILKDLDIVDKFIKNASDEYKKLDVVILREIIFNAILGIKDPKIDEDIFYERWWTDAVDKVDSGKYKVAFILNPTRAQQVLDIAKKHERMPQKSTDFYPKMISGLTMMDLEEGEKLE